MDCATHNVTIFTNEYTISKTASELSWYEAMQMCRKKGGELPTIENVAEVSWIRTQWLLRSKRNNPQNKSVFIFYVNLHKWVYNLDGWGWSSGAPLNISGITLQSGDFCTNYSESSCASLDWTNVSSDPYMLEDLCQVRSTFMTLVCKRPKTSRERSTTSHRPNDKILWCFERKWVLLTVSSVLVFVFVLLTMALVVYCALSRRAHKRYNKDSRTSPESNSDRDSDSESDSELPSPIPNSSDANTASRRTISLQQWRCTSRAPMQFTRSTSPTYPRSSRAMRHSASSSYEVHCDNCVVNIV